MMNESHHSAPWAASARAKYFQIASQAEAGRAAYRAVNDRFAAVVQTLSRAESRLREIEKQIATGKAEDFVIARLPAAQAEVANIRETLAQLQAQAAEIEQASRLPMRLANEGRKLLRDLNILRIDEA